ncbi:MAG: hypothetical protein IT422_29635 [Pirellulaceae bacterium]|nr:hypothetical protein [Pirellulaceae bacterium]
MSSVKTNKKPTLVDLEERLQALSEMQRDVSEKMKALYEDRINLVLEVLYRANQKSGLADGDQKDTNRIDFRELCRTLLLSRERCDAAIMCAIRRYREALKDQQQLKQLLGNDVESLTVVQNMVNRYAVYHRQDLEMLGVNVVEVSAGVRVDPSFHHVVGRHPTKRLSEVGTVAVALTPMLTWTDSKNTPQSQPAEVIAFIGDTEFKPGSATRYSQE